jgi:hypothetical protein
MSCSFTMAAHLVSVAYLRSFLPLFELLKVKVSEWDDQEDKDGNSTVKY